MFNFNKDNVKEGSGVAIFNEGNAGRVENVSIAVTKKGVDYNDENGKNNPDYKVVYTDPTGASTSEGFYYLNEATFNAQFGTFEKAVEKQWNKFATIVTAAGGDPTIQAANPVEILDKMAMLTRNAVPGKSFNVFTNYGTTQNPKKYLQIRSWTPFIESADTPESESKLKAGKLDQMERMDTPSEGGGSGAAPMAGWV